MKLKVFVAAFRREIAHMAARLPERPVTSVFFGGGTPSLMQPATVGAILDAVARHWTVSPDIEVTLEANPTSVEATRSPRDTRPRNPNPGAFPRTRPQSTAPHPETRSVSPHKAPS